MYIWSFVVENLRTILTAVSSMVGSCAWPVAAVVILLVLRQPLLGLIDNVSLSLLKVGKIEMEFGSGVRAAERSADAAELPGPDTDRPEAEELSFALGMVEVEPRSAVLSTWLQLESALHRCVREVAPEKYTRDTPVSALAFTRYLLKRQILSPEVAETIAQMRRLRNLAVHSVDFAPSTEAVLEYMLIAERVINYITSVTAEWNDPRQ